MRKLILAFAVIAALLTAQLSSRALAGESCCICSQCAGGPSECALPPISCDVTCAQAGCSGFTGGVSEACNVLPPCGSSAPSVTTAPAAGRPGVAALAAALAGVGLLRLVRRRA